MIIDILAGALGAMTKGPRSLKTALALSTQLNSDAVADADLDAYEVTALFSHLKSTEPSDAAFSLFLITLAAWDATSDEISWTDGTQRNSENRRVLIYNKLELDTECRLICTSQFPFFPFDPPVVIAKSHQLWYTKQIRESRTFYWNSYVKQLRSVHAWPEPSLLQLDESTVSIVERLANPCDEAAYQSKGLVVGYVQSGKTASFTGVIAKAADAGYRLIIVLAGTLDVLRSQTQRRVDKDLIGREMLGEDYQSDDDYAAFLRHGELPSILGHFDWVRLTGPESDYKSLRRGIDALAFDRPSPDKPLWHSDNCLRSKAKIAVVKKNKAILGRIIRDLGELKKHGLGAPIDQISALIIDDESDQAGINTKRQKDGVSPEDQERSSINEAIVKLLKMLPRAQYVGYTATPFANVFVDPTSEADIFPKDFLISLPRPSGYMGVSDFYDLEGSDDDEESRPNYRDFVRPIVGEDNATDNLVKAIDTFVLAGAIKLYRSNANPKLRYRHHTMLAHASAFVAQHDSLVTKIKTVFQEAAYDAGLGIARLKSLFNADFAAVSSRRAPELPFPERFDQLREFIGQCLEKVRLGPEPVRTINNTKPEDTPDFDRQEVWSILVGGTKLSRGYTIEGLTVSYYRRGAQAADTLMQMGRWFGFRSGYGDLVRLFIATREPLDKKQTRFLNLYEAFGAICRDEEMFRDELKRYARLDDPRITPAQIPPLVPSHMLMPTAANKMYNAVIKSRNFGGLLAESTQAPFDTPAKESNRDELLSMLDGVPLHRVTVSAENQAARDLHLDVVVGTVANDRMLQFLRAYSWLKRGSPLKLQLEYLEGKYGDPSVVDWLFFVPQTKDPIGEIEIAGLKIGVVYRSREEGDPEKRLNTYNDPRHRFFAEYITGVRTVTRPDEDIPETSLGDKNDEIRTLRAPSASLAKLHTPKRGVFMYYPITENENKLVQPITTGFTLLFPPNAIIAPITFSVHNPNDPETPIVAK